MMLGGGLDAGRRDTILSHLSFVRRFAPTQTARGSSRAISTPPSGGTVMAYNILIMGASYGSLLASKLLFGGHAIKLICLPAEADLINAEGFRVRLPVKG